MVADDDDLVISFLIVMAIAIAIAIDGAAVAGFAAVFLVDAARNVEANATAIVSAVCCVCRCVNSDIGIVLTCNSAVPDDDGLVLRMLLLVMAVAAAFANAAIPAAVATSKSLL